ncbi:uncharacterized protein LOC133645320 isoform X3 [Entelurus aequoreus]|uniref:uncharacterized protein LOC133645320 isoform X3 n=1 Tax=Entelurus aequoreus TaxID=161455 RepID=UPI002B1E4582|nr:uncharacterized protein LOC133645320 isoform X3 [Entelurus aequoreus]
MKCWLSRAGTPGGPLACASVGDISALLTRLRSGWFPVGPAVDWTPADVLDPLWTGLSQCYVRPTRHPLLSVSPRGGGLPTYAVLSKVSHSHSPTSHWETTTPEMCPVKNRPTRTLITKVPWVNNGNSLHRNGNSRGWMSHNKKVEKKKKLIDYGVGTDYKGGPAQIFRYQKYLRVSAVSRAPHLPIFPLDSDCLPRPPHSDLDFWTPLSCPHGPRSDHEPLLLRPSGLLCCNNQHTLTITSAS